MFVVGEDRQVHFAETGTLTPEDLDAAQQQVRARTLRWFARAGLLDPTDARDMLCWHHGGGFSRFTQSSRAAAQRLDDPGLPRSPPCHAPPTRHPRRPHRCGRQACSPALPRLPRAHLIGRIQTSRDM
jgi:hypothetical protein